MAQPDSVYCSSDCILKHAAATMKFLSAGKEPKAKPKEKAKAKPERLILPKCSVQVSCPRPPPHWSSRSLRVFTLQPCWLVCGEEGTMA